MNVKRLSAILIAITFCIVVLISLVELFSIKKVEAQFFVVSENVESAQSVLDEYEGKNLLFLLNKFCETKNLKLVTLSQLFCRRKFTPQVYSLQFCLLNLMMKYQTNPKSIKLPLSPLLLVFSVMFIGHTVLFYQYCTENSNKRAHVRNNKSQIYQH